MVRRRVVVQQRQRQRRHDHSDWIINCMFSIVVVVVVAAAVVGCGYMNVDTTTVAMVAEAATTAAPPNSRLLWPIWGRRNKKNPQPNQQQPTTQRKIVVVVIGSINADTFLSVERLPTMGENIMTLDEPIIDVPGGKGCTQAVAAAKLLSPLHNNDNENEKNDEDESNTTATTKRSATPATVYMIGQFGNDTAAAQIQDVLRSLHVNTTLSTRHTNITSGRGYVCKTPQGQVNAIVSGGANLHGWNTWQKAWDQYQHQQLHNSTDNIDYPELDQIYHQLDTIFRPLKPSSDNHTGDDSENNIDNISYVVLLQSEVPEAVNLLVATYCQHWKQQQQQQNAMHNSSQQMVVILDIGGEDRPIASQLLSTCDYIMPNESELRRLVHSMSFSSDDDRSSLSFVPNDNSSDNKADDDDIAQMASWLQQHHGANHILVTRGRQGSTLLYRMDNKDNNRDDDLSSTMILHQPACSVTSVVDETGAGDCYRAAFAVALAEQQLCHNNNDNDNQLRRSKLKTCMEFAAAAGACAVTKHGAVPSTPSRKEVVEQQLHDSSSTTATPPEMSPTTTTVTRGGGGSSTHRTNDDDDDGTNFPFGIGSRLNSMKDRPDLWPRSLETPHDFVQRQSQIQGLTCVDFNYPQHFHKWTTQEAKAALDNAGLVAGAVCLRYPAPTFVRGAMNHPNPSIRQQAIDLTKQAAQAAMDLNCNEVVIWSAYDGYDYPFQVDYDTKWNELVTAFRECCDAYPSIKFSIEYKPTDENTRFFTVPSTGAAVLLMHEVDRANFGLTLDVGHMLMSGENPAQSIAMAGRTGKLFGIQLNDGYTRLAAEDGLMFGSIHPSMALEIMYQLRRIQFAGHIYFDTFPQRTDPIREAEYNIRRVKAFWKAAACFIDDARLHTIQQHHDAVGALELIDDALRKM